jgi:hypothetical protein
MQEEHNMAVRIQLRRDTAANWTSVNPTLLSGEIGIETDTLKFKIGNGQRWNQITSYAFKMGEANGMATLNSEGKIPASQLPTALSITADINSAFAAMTTSGIPEGTNLYFTDARAVAAVATQIAAEVSLRNAAIETAKSQAVTISTTDATNKAAAAQQNAIAAAETKDLTAIASATQAANTYTDSKVATEATARNSAITSAVAAETTNRGIAINAAISAETTARTAAIAAVTGSTNLSSKTTNDLAEGSSNLYFTNSRAISALNPTLTDRFAAVNGSMDDLSAYLLASYTTTAAADSKYVLQSGLSNTLDGYVMEAEKDLAFGYAGLDAAAKLNIAVVPTTIARSADVTSSISAAISTEVADRNTAITSAIDSLINSAPGTLNTLGEIAAALQADVSGLTALTTTVNLKAPLASPTFTGTVTLPVNTVKSSDLSWEAYDAETNLPSATTKHGMFAHVHGTGSAYYAHSGSWRKLLNTTEAELTYAPLSSPTFTGSVDFSTATVTGLDAILPNQMGYTGKYLKTDGTNASWEDLDLTLYLTTAIAATTYATLDNAKTYGYHNAGSNTAANKIAYGTSATGYSAIATPAAGDIYIQY